MEQNQSLDIRKIAEFLQGTSKPENNIEVERLKNLLQNYSKAGNAFLYMFVYKSISRISKLMDVIEILENKIYSTDKIESYSTKELFELHNQLNNSLNQSLTFINTICNKPTDKKNITNNILLNFTGNVLKVDNALPYDKTERQSIREAAGRLLNIIESTSSSK